MSIMKVLQTCVDSLQCFFHWLFMEHGGFSYSHTYYSNNTTITCDFQIIMFNPTLFQSMLINLIWTTHMLYTIWQFNIINIIKKKKIGFFSIKLQRTRSIQIKLYIQYEYLLIKIKLQLQTIYYKYIINH